MHDSFIIKKKKRLLFIFGTRPEAIKVAPLIKIAKSYTEFLIEICVTAQHRGMLDQVLNFFEIKPDYDLNLMQEKQTLHDITSSSIIELQNIINISKPDLIIVQGDTVTAFAGALAGFYKKIKIAHIESGLRSGNKYSPYPEEIFRVLIDHMSDYLFAPTEVAKKNLNKENIKNNVYVVGNTSIDALLLGIEIIKKNGEEQFYQYFNFLDFQKKIILITNHRRENIGKPLKNICLALKFIANTYYDTQLVFLLHPNPHVKNVIKKELSNLENVFLLDPIDYHYMIWLMKKCYLIITDSGGIQEEGVSLGKPILITRNVTERVEGVIAGNAKIVGSNIKNITLEFKSLLENSDYYNNMSICNNIYGDGKTCQYILNILSK